MDILLMQITNLLLNIVLSIVMDLESGTREICGTSQFQVSLVYGFISASRVNSHCKWELNPCLLSKQPRSKSQQVQYLHNAASISLTSESVVLYCVLHVCEIRTPRHLTC